MDFGDPFPSEPASLRPALVIARSEPSELAPTRFVVPGTTTRRGLPAHVEVEPTTANGFTTPTYFEVEKLRSVGRHRVVRRIGACDAATSSAVRTHSTG